MIVMELFNDDNTPSTPSGADPFGEQGQGEQPPDDPADELFTYGDQYDPLDPDLQTGLRYTHSVNQPAPNDLFEPMQVDYDPMRNALDMGEQRMQEANLELNEQARERFERAKFRTLWNIMGPETFNLISGAGVDTGTEEALRLQMDAEDVANQIEQETTQQEAEQEVQNAYERAQLLMQERQQNEQAERESRINEYEAEQQRRQNIAGAASSAFSTQAQRDAAQQQAQAERRQAAADRRNEAAIAAQDRQLEYMNMERDLLSDLGDDPQVLPMLGRVRQAQMPNASADQIQASLGRDYLAAMLSNPDRMAPRGAGGSGEDAGPWSAVAQSQGALTQAHSLLNSMGDNEALLWGDSRDDEYTAQGNRRSYTEDVRNLVPYVKDQLNNEINAVQRANRDRDSVPPEVLSDIQRAQQAIDALDEIEVQSLEDADRVKDVIEPLVRDSFLGSDPVPQVEGVGGRVQDIVIGTHHAIRSVDDPAIPAVAAYAGVPEEEIIRGYAALQNGGVGALSEHAQGVNQRQNAGQESQPDINQRVDRLVGGREVEQQQSAFDAIEESGFDGTVKTMTPMEYAELSRSEREQLQAQIQRGETAVVIDRGQGEPPVSDLVSDMQGIRQLNDLARDARSDARSDRAAENRAAIWQSVKDVASAPFDFDDPTDTPENRATRAVHRALRMNGLDPNELNLSERNPDEIVIEEGVSGPEVRIFNGPYVEARIPTDSAEDAEALRSAIQRMR